MHVPDPDEALRRALRRHKAAATGLLGLMAAGVLASMAIPPGLGDGWVAGLLSQACRAGVVGGLADWFAVTALFRHPLGLPIPHTAILPRQKARLGAALGRFVATHVFTDADVTGVLRRLDLPAILHRFLADTAAAHPAAEALAGTLPRILAAIEDGRARRLAARLLPRVLGGPGAGRVVARALRTLVEGGRHQEMFGFLLVQLRILLDAKEEALLTAIEERVREQGGRLMGWALGASIARRVIGVLAAELDKTGPDGSELRAAFDEWVRREITQMEDDPARAAELGAGIGRGGAHEPLRAWLWDIWARLRLALEADAARPGGRVVAATTAALGNLGARLESDPAARARVQAAGEAIARRLLPAAQTQLATFIGDVVGGWDAATVTEKLELRVGKDLQFVRVNGTLVGFLVGGVLYAGMRWWFGAG